MKECVLVFVAGYGNSEPQHWQRLWYGRSKNAIWVEQSDWEAPQMDMWVDALAKSVESVEKPLFFVAHSLGCTTVAAWEQLRQSDHEVLGALMVAPPDINRKDFPEAIKGYNKMKIEQLTFPSTLVYSMNDPYSSEQSSLDLAKKWGSKPKNIGNKGHINLSSNLGMWEQGWKIFQDLLICVRD